MSIPTIHFYAKTILSRDQLFYDKKKKNMCMYKTFK